MLRIGFTNKYFTLWEVGSETKIGFGNLPYIKHYFNYIQNLSMDKDQAIEKAKEMGCTVLEVDESLRGQNSSFVTEEKLYCFIGRNKSPFFEFGKYKDELILESSDLDYLEWYYGETNNVHAQNILIKNKILFEVNGKVVTKSEFDKVNLINSLGNKIVVEFTSNLRKYFYFSNLYGAGTLAEIDGVELLVHFDEVKEYWYNQYNYFLPTINGAGKRIKDREVELIGEVKENTHEGLTTTYFHVTKFKILPKTK